jgi:hypothetical protein
MWNIGCADIVILQGRELQQQSKEIRVRNRALVGIDLKRLEICMMNSHFLILSIVVLILTFVWTNTAFFNYSCIWIYNKYCSCILKELSMLTYGEVAKN